MVILGLVLSLLPLSLLTLAYAVLGEPYRPIFKRHRLPLPSSWPKDLSIVHISDLHVRRLDQRLLRVQREALGRLPTPDLLCVTGDVCEKVDDIPLLVDVLRSVKPRLGTFVVLGNHEHNAHAPHKIREAEKRGIWRLIGAILHLVAPKITSDGEEEGHAMAEALRAAGITVLHNEGVRVHKHGRSVWIAGCDSAWAGHADMQAAMRGRRPGEACLSLIHEPDLAFDAEALGADLVLAGHTHGGQIRLPLIGAPYSLRLDPRIGIASGFQKLEAGLLHITTGLGHTIPLRFGCPPEVVWMDTDPLAAEEELAA
ncbi:MAG: metallophosphoesterase [Chloroflexi bacterium]|nr:metallophosphoesterase [Chloroflexota bacterium]MBV9894573.1 metallophosphoesterase [Chloroflexota bacterium]